MERQPSSCSCADCRTHYRQCSTVANWIAELEGTVVRLAATVKEQETQIQKVSAQLELSKPAPQTVLNNQ